MCLFYYYYHPLWLITHFIVVLRSLWCTACNMIQSAMVNKTKYDSKWKLLWCIELWWTHNKRRTITSNFIPLTRCVKFIVQYVLNLFHWQDVSNLFNVFCIVVDAVPFFNHKTLGVSFLMSSGAKVALYDASRAWWTVLRFVVFQYRKYISPIFFPWQSFHFLWFINWRAMIDFPIYNFYTVFARALCNVDKLIASVLVTGKCLFLF